MRLIDADKLKKCAIPCEIHNGALTELCVPLYQIDNATTVNIPNYGGQVVPDLLQGWRYEEKPQGEWIDYDNTFYKCPECGYLLEKCCPQCQNKVILPKGGAE